MNADLLTISETAERLGVSAVTLRRWIRRGEFPVPVFTKGRVLRVGVRALDSYIDEINEGVAS